MLLDLKTSNDLFISIHVNLIMKHSYHFDRLYCTIECSVCSPKTHLFNKTCHILNSSPNLAISHSILLLLHPPLYSLFYWSNLLTIYFTLYSSDDLCVSFTYSTVPINDICSLCSSKHFNLWLWFIQAAWHVHL